jgi:hypothetical protein
LTTALTPDGGLALPLSLGAGLLVVPALPQLGVQTGALHLALEAPERAIETFIVLNYDFQDDQTSLKPTLQVSQKN